MLLKSIELKNFRQFMDEKIDFSVDTDKNVTLIIGENGSGKTTFAQAFFWCFYSETSFTDKIILNRKVAEKLTPNEEAEVSVTVQLKHGDAEYGVVRKQKHKKSLGNKVNPANTVLDIYVKSADGNTKWLKSSECELEIKNILPKELSSYFFFDGERIEKMSKEVLSGRKSSSFAEAVTDLTGLKAISVAIDHLSPTRTTSVMGRFNADYVDDSDGKFRALSGSIEKLQNRINEIENRLTQIDTEIEAANLSKDRFRNEIKGFEDGARLQRERDNLQNNLIKTKNYKARLIKELCGQFNKEMTTFFSMSMVKNALTILSKSDFGGKDIPELHSKTIDYLLKRKMCICGTHLDEGTMPCNEIKKLKDYLPPQSISVTVGHFISDVKSRYSNKVSLFADVSEKMGAISEHNDTISDYNNEINIVSQKLSGDDVQEKVRSLNAKIRTCEKSISDLSNEKTNILIEKGSCEKDKSLKEESRSKLSLLNNRNQHIERCKAYTQKIYQDLFDEYKAKEKETREKLGVSINEIFKSIYAGGLSLVIDEKYNISVIDNEYNGAVETSTAQSISVIFAFISAIVKLAKENKQANSEESYSEPYPLVMDAPMSAFDKRRIEAICSAIPQAAEQVIIFIKDTDGELAEQHLGSKVMVTHRFEKIDEFQTKLI